MSSRMVSNLCLFLDSLEEEEVEERESVSREASWAVRAEISVPNLSRVEPERQTRSKRLLSSGERSESVWVSLECL